MINARQLQQRLGVTVDGDIGPGTLAALFKAMGAGVERSTELGLAANVHFRRYDILDNGLRLTHFMGQVAHESGGFRYMEEIASGAAYEGRADLGNTQRGDGVKFKGRGPIQLTGRANYRRFGRAIGIDLERYPEIVAYPSLGLWAGCEYWANRGINALADRDDIEAVTRAINGGLNGLADRRVKTAKARALIL